MLDQRCPQIKCNQTNCQTNMSFLLPFNPIINFPDSAPKGIAELLLELSEAAVGLENRSKVYGKART
jgi:hypothetical protein